MEPYSIAMTVCDAIPNVQSWDLRILATDIDTTMLDRGKSGVYADADVDTIPASYRKRWVTEKDRTIEMDETLKQLISFKRLNFLDPWPVKGPFDLIFCRNVVIYFDKDLQRVLFNQFANVLKPDGWLYIGHSENLHGISDRFVPAGRTIYRKVK